MIFRCSRHALDRYRQHHPSATYTELTYACEKGTEVEHDLVRVLTGRFKKERSGGRDDIYKSSPDGYGIFVIVPMREGSEAMIRTYLRMGIKQVDFLREKLLSLPPVESKREILVFSPPGGPLPSEIPDHILKEYAIAALKAGVFVKPTKGLDRCVAWRQEQSIDTDKDAIFTLALWYQIYIAKENKS